MKEDLKKKKLKRNNEQALDPNGMYMAMVYG